MSERRRFERRPIEVPVSVSTRERQDRVGLIRDVSASGMLFHSRSKFAVGERVRVWFRVEKRIGSTAGEVVRAACDTNEDNIFRFLTAVRFDAPLLDLPL
jgi:hypothetical protein